MTVPTARAARGWPTRDARAPQVVVSPYGNLRELAQYRDRKRRQRAKVEREIERTPAALEVLVELAAGIVDAAACAARSMGRRVHMSRDSET